MSAVVAQLTPARIIEILLESVLWIIANKAHVSGSPGFFAVVCAEVAGPPVKERHVAVAAKSVHDTVYASQRWMQIIIRRNRRPQQHDVADTTLVHPLQRPQGNTATGTVGDKVYLACRVRSSPMLDFLRQFPFGFVVDRSIGKVEKKQRRWRAPGKDEHAAALRR